MKERTTFAHKVYRCTDPSSAQAKFDELANAGYRILSVTSGGADGNVLWIVGQLATVIQPVAHSHPEGGLLGNNGQQLTPQ